MEKLIAIAYAGGYWQANVEHHSPHEIFAEKEFWTALIKQLGLQVNQAPAMHRRFWKWTYHYGFDKAVEDLVSRVL